MINMKTRVANMAAVLAILTLLALLLVPPPGPSHAQFTGQATFGGTSGGTANAQTITIPNYPSNLTGVELTFIVGVTNTGPTTLNFSGLGAVAVLRPSSIGYVALSGQEFTINELASVKYNGSSYIITSNVDTTPIGKTVELRGTSTSAPRGSLMEDGSCVSRTTYAPLFSVVGTTYGVCDGSTTFGVPDSRGTVFAALDNQGVNGSANRITTGGSGCNGTTNGLLCGSQSYTMLTANLPPYTPIGSSGVTSFDHTTANSTCQVGAGVAVTDANTLTRSSFTAQGGTSTPFAILQPLLLGRRAIKY